jgi:hypothetical protein
MTYGERSRPPSPKEQTQIPLGLDEAHCAGDVGEHACARRPVSPGGHQTCRLSY